MSIPIITLEVAAMKHTMQLALTEHAAKLDTGIQAAVEAYCTPENILAVVTKEATEAMDAAVKAEVRSFFGYGQRGRQAVREAVHAWLDREYPVELYPGEQP